MSKAVLISIRPKWVEKIANGEKLIEVRKTRPKLQTPFKCYIYCTLPKYPHEDFILTDYPKPQFYGGGKVIGEFTCDRIDEYDDDTIFSFRHEDYARWNDFDLDRACMHPEDIQNYATGKWLYGWHLSDLRIYDEARELSEFQRATDPCDSCHAEYTWECTDCKKWGGDIKRPPQSWCYVEGGADNG